jgi:hypothetical protein
VQTNAPRATPMGDSVKLRAVTEARSRTTGGSGFG